MGLERIPYGRQSIDQADIDAVSASLKTPWLTQGPGVTEFEQALAEFCGAKYAVAVSSATAGLHLSAAAAGFGSGDEVVTSPISFLATSNGFLYTGARPVFADIRREDANLDPESVQKNISRKTKGIIAVHMAGLPADMAAFAAIAKKKKLTVIEDCAHAIGSEYRGTQTGSCAYSDLCVFSFHPVKPITTGEGGAVTTNDSKLYEKLKALRSHGVYRSPGMQKKKGGWYYEMKHIGFNYRITEFQCRLGISQLKKLPRFTEIRREIAAHYDEAFKDLREELHLPELRPHGRSSAWHLYVIRMKHRPEKTRRSLYDYLKTQGIDAQVHYIPIYHQPYYRQILKKKPRCPQAELYYKETLSLPIFPDLTPEDQRRVVRAVRDFFKK